MIKILSTKGYSIEKKEINVEKLKKLKKSLTLIPKHHPDFPVTPLRAYEESVSFIRIPRVFGIDTYGDPNHNFLIPRENSKDSWDPLLQALTYSFTGKLFDNQQEILNPILDHLKTEKTGILSLYTGFGKSILATSIISELKQKTIIIVHKTELLRQWQSVINKFLPNVSVGVVAGQVRDIKPTHQILIVMIQTLISMGRIRDQPSGRDKKKLLDPIIKWGHTFTIIDEVHHCPAETFSRIFFMIQSCYMLGLSASVERKDGLTQALYWHLGKIICHRDPDRNGQVGQIYRYNYKDQYTSLERRAYSTLISKICNDEKRTLYICDILGCFIDQQKYKILVLSDRISHLNAIHNILKEKEKNCDIGVFTAGMKLEKFKDKTIILSTYTMFSEGISLNELNMIVFASPKKDIVQPLGRILRKVHENSPVVVDIVDDILSNQYRQRLKMYKTEFCDKVDVFIKTFPEI